METSEKDPEHFVCYICEVGDEKEQLAGVGKKGISALEKLTKDGGDS